MAAKSKNVLLLSVTEGSVGDNRIVLQCKSHDGSLLNLGMTPDCAATIISALQVLSEKAESGRAGRAAAVMISAAKVVMEADGRVRLSFRFPDGNETHYEMLGGDAALLASDFAALAAPARATRQ